MSGEISVFEVQTYGRYVFRWKLVCRVRYKQTSLTDGTITDDHTLDGLHVVTADTPLRTLKQNGT